MKLRNLTTRIPTAIFPLALGLTACQGDTEPTSAYDWQLPPGFPEPPVPDDNPMTAEKVALGRSLFYDVRLSGNQSMSCGSCHLQSKAFSDGKILSTGSTGDTVHRNAMALVNVAYNSTYTWPNPLLTTLEDQAMVPMFGEFPVELGMTPYEAEILNRLAADEAYPALFSEAFPEDPAPISTANVVRALASFERTLISGRSPYDRYVYQGDKQALSDEALRGMQLFFSETTECYHCHSGLNFTTAFRTAESAFTSLDFHNTGLYNLGGTGAYPSDNVGLIEFSGNEADMGKFRVPTLRNVGLTAPYMHDGSIATLEDVIEHYNVGGRTISEGVNAGVGAENPYKDPLVRPMNLSTDEKKALVAFLQSLTDEAFITDPRLADPFASSLH
ncbi:MAG: MbnH family di-heme enzyme [Myxococcota bacterium]